MRPNLKKVEIPSAEALKLDRIRRAVERLGHPELGRKTVLVAGTNGKGSTCAYLTAFFMAAGYRVGTYSSPHVVHRGERIRIDSLPVSEVELASYERRYAQYLEPLTYFERYTLLAFLIFRDRKVDVQVLEVGLGGRLDATNISDPDLSVISRIDYDHQEILGSTLTKIAREKAGIMRFGRPVVIGRQVREAFRSLRKCASWLQSELIDASSMRFNSMVERKILKVGRVRGIHQSDNLRLAIVSFSRAMDQWAWNFRWSDLLKAFEASLWPARIQILRSKPTFVVDGSHNLNSIDALVDWLKRRHEKKWHFVFGAMSDKPIQKMIEKLAPFAKSVSLPRAYYKEREASSDELKKLWQKAIRKMNSSKKGSVDFEALQFRVEVVTDLESEIVNLWNSKTSTLVVGSLYLAGAVLLELEKYKAKGEVSKWIHRRGEK